MENHDYLEHRDIDELDELEDDFDDEILREYRMKRMEELKMQA
jgi:hypothetical protein